MPLNEFLSHPITIIAVTGIPSFVLGRWIEHRSSKKSADIATYKYLKNQLPTFDQIHSFFNEKSLTESFSTETFDKFGRAFEEIVINPEKHFLYETLQEHAEKIKRLHQEMDLVIGQDTFSVNHRLNHQSIRRIKYGFDTDDLETGRILNENASLIYKAYLEFLKESKSTLHISPE